MKKLLILMLVIGMTSAANAALTWSVDEITIDLASPTAVVQIISDTTDAYTEIWAGADASLIAEITSMATLAGAAEGGAVASSAYLGWWVIEAVDFTPPSDIAVGDHFDVTLTGLSLGTYVISTDSYGGAGLDDLLTITVVPEPMTIALLGLGGLFLLRRRK